MNTLKQALESFREASLTRRVAARFAMEFPSEEARKKYLQDHPGADPKKHTVKKDEGGSSKGDASGEASKSESRGKDTDEHFDRMKSLKKKVDNADKGALEKFNRAHSKIFENGESAAKVADKLIKKFKDAEGEAGSAVELLEHKLRDWNQSKSDHYKSMSGTGSEKMRQAEQTHAYAQSVEQAISMLNKALKGEYD